MSKVKKEKKMWQKILIWIGWILGICVAAVALLFLWLTIVEYKPQDVEELTVAGTSSKVLKENDTFKICTWNVGYGALGDNADFFMDGGTHVMTASQDRVNENLNGIISTLKEISPDIVFLQEVDTNAKRSYGIDETKVINEAFPNMMNSFALNFKVAYIPYPFPPIGKVEAGIETLSQFELLDATRYQLPVPFKWPTRLGNLKRCLMIDRVPIEGTDKELVLVNLHLEAYDAGEGKAAQTKMLRDILENEKAKGNYIIAGGDFNQVFSNVDTSKYPTLEGKWHAGEIDVAEFDGWQMMMDETLPSCRSLDQPLVGADLDHFQWYVIDGFIVSDNLDVKSIKTQNKGFQNSDHNPVVMEITLK